jgi:rod shape-determining protein MreC
MTTLTLRQTLVLVTLFVVASTAFVALDNRRALDPIKTTMLDVVQPVAHGLRELSDGSESELEQEVARLLAENNALRAENIALQDALIENEQLKRQLEVQEEHPDWQLVTARVINPDPTSYQKYVTIDKGSADGIEVGMAVVDPYNLVGIVSSVTEHSAKVILSIDVSFGVGARLIKSGGNGVAYGAWQQQGRIVLRHVDRDLVPEGEDAVVTAGDDSTVKSALVPPNLPIGYVIGEPIQDVQNDTLTIEVAPFCDFDRLKVVSVIVKTND